MAPTALAVALAGLLLALAGLASRPQEEGLQPPPYQQPSIYER